MLVAIVMEGQWWCFNDFIFVSNYFRKLGWLICLGKLLYIFERKF